MNKFALGLAAGLVALTSAAALAGDRGSWGGYWGDRSGERREAAQEHQIDNARRSGQLTRSEYQALQAEQARIDAMQRRAQADGRIDRYEAAQIRRAQNEASRHIYQESHDGEKSRRYWYRWW